MIDLPPVTPHIEIVVASEGMSKGLAQTESGQALARIELASGGLYAGGQIKNITSPSAEAESALFVGWRGRVDGFDLNGSATYKRWLWTHGPGDGEALELSVAASRTRGRVTPRIALTYSPDELGATAESLYAEGGASVRLTSSTSLSASVARRERALQLDYTAFNAGVTHAFGGHFSADLRIHDTDRSGLSRAYRPRVVLVLRARF